MKLKSVFILLWLTAIPLFAEPPTNISFNLVQVNHYHGQDSVLKNVTTPGERVVIDLQSPTVNALQALTGVAPTNTKFRVEYNTNNQCYKILASGSVLDWETSAVIYAPSGQDSFLVTSSRTGCPGTEVRPSVSVAFATARGWSYPPIRFGPLSSNTVCSLGKGMNLVVNSVGDNPPKVSLASSSGSYSRR